MDILKGWKFDSPRGPIMIDPETRDIVQDQHVHEVVKSGGRLKIKVLSSISQVKDPCKANQLGKCASN
jgi:branched-chain amino acid transport system substrate-binding protein